MEQTTSDAVSAWLDREDSVDRAGRHERLTWLIENAPGNNQWVFVGGPLSQRLFEEARYCFVYGQFLATITLGFSSIEQTLAAMFYALGRNDLERANVSVLLDLAQSEGWFSASEYDDLVQAKKWRNAVAHFRRPGHDDSIDRRAVLDDLLPYEVIEDDARRVLTALFRLVARAWL